METAKKMKKRIRADELLCERGHFETRDEAARHIMAGKVRLNADMVLRKPSELLTPETPLIVESSFEYVSRGALKLIDALEQFLPDLTGKTALDMGSSTGGFTDVMLKHNAEKVYACDVGKGLLHAKLRTDSRVVVCEGLNVRDLANGAIPEQVDLVTSDLSFISVTMAMKPADSLMKSGAYAFLLVKPQFEAPKNMVPHGGVVTDPAVHAAAVDKVVACGVNELGWTHLATCPSPVKGAKGNQEFIAVFRKK